MALLDNVRTFLARRRETAPTPDDEGGPTLSLVNRDEPAGVVEPKVPLERSDSEVRHEQTTEAIGRVERLLEQQISLVRGQDQTLGTLPEVARRLPVMEARTDRLGQEIAAALEPLPEIRDRTETLDKRLSGVAEPLAAIDRRTAELSKQLGSTLERSSERETVLRESLARLGDTSEGHGTALAKLSEIAESQHQTLAQIRQQLAAVSRSVAETGATLSDLSEAVETLSTTRTQTVEAIHLLTAETRDSSAALAQTLKRVEQWVLAALVIAGGASVIALIAAGVALFG